MLLKKVNIENIRRFKDKILSDKKLLIYLFFVGLATLFWFLNTLSKTYTTEINYPVKFVNMPSNKILVNKLPQKLVLRVNAYGFDILRYQIRAIFMSSYFDVEKYTNQKINKASISEYILYTADIQGKISNNLASDINLLQVYPSKIMFRFSPVASKKVPIKLQSKLSYRKQFKKNGEISIEPDSVEIKGAKSLLDSITYIETQLVELSDLHQTVKENIALKSPKDIALSPKEISYNIPVERFTEASIKVNVEIKNLPQTVFLRLFPSEIRINYFVGMQEYSLVKPEQFKAEVDYNEAIKNSTGKLKVTLKSYPLSIYNVRIYPETVSYLIEKKQ